MKKVIFLLLSILVISGLCAVEVTIGTGTSYNSYSSSPSPYANYYKNERDQYLITASELNAAGGGEGDITSIAFNVYSVNYCDSRPMTIKMGHTASSILTTTFITDLTTVWNNSNYQPVTGWNTHTLDSPFYWNGTSNIVVEVFFGDITSDYLENASVYYSSNPDMALYYRSDTINANTVASGTLSGNRPNMKFNMQEYIPSTPPGPANIVSPLNNVLNIALNATLNWSAGSGLTTGYKLYFGTDGNGTSTPTNIKNNYECGSSTTYTPSSGELQYSTTYYWQIVPYNNIGPADITACPIWSFTTMADPTIYPPFTESFENGNIHDTAVFGWTQESVSGSDVWTANNSYTNYNRTPRSGNWNAFLRYSNTRWMFKPIQLEADINYRIIIYARQDAASGASIQISYGATATAAGMTNAIIYNTDITNGEYQRLEGIFSTTASGLYYIGILGTLNYSPYYLSIDDITIEEVPENPVCSVYPESWDFGTVVLGSSATKQFTISNTGAGKLMINSVETAGDYYSIISSPTDTELEAGENTNFTVKYEPGAESKGTHQGSVVIHYGDSEEKIIPLTGTCVDATIYEDDLPYTENFDSVTAPALPLGWTSYVNSTSSYAVIQTYTYSSPYTTPNHIYMYNYDDNNAALILISPMIDVPLNTLRTSFYAMGSSYYTYTLNIGTMTDPTNGDTFTSLTTINLTGTYTKYTVNLNSYTGSDQYLAFKHGLGGTYRSIYLDDFLLELMPSVIEPSNLTVSNITEDSAVLGWTENNVPPATTWDIIYGAPGFNPNAKATQIQVTSNPYTLTGLQVNTTYEWYVRAVKDGNVSAWVGPSSFTTLQIPAELPFTENFDDEINWTIVNGTETNKWFVGTVPAYEGNSAYISKDGGTTYEYNNGSTSVVHLYRDIEFIAGALEYNLSFMLKCGGESIWDGLKVFLVDTSTIPAAGTQLTTGQIGNPWYNLTTDWTAKTITIGNAVAGSTKRLVFSWRNDSSGGTQPPAAIDNIVLTYTMPNPSPEPPSNPVPADLATDVPLNQILSWTNNGTVTKVDVYFGLSGNMVLVSENQTDPLNSYDPELEYSKTYQWKIVAKNDEGETAEGPVWSFSTMADPTIYSLPYLNDFQSNINGWTILDENNDNIKWERSTEISPNMAMKIGYNDDLAMDDWFITPPIHLTEGITYEIKYDYRAQSSTWTEKLKVCVGDSPSPTALTTTLNDHPEIDNTTFNLGTATFTPSTTGTYFIGFHGYSDADMYNLYVDNFRITLENSDIVSGTASGGNVSIVIPPVHSISPTIDISNLGESDATVTVIAGYADVALPNAGLSLTLTGTSFSGATITITHNLGFNPEQIAYRIEPGTWNILTSLSSEVTNWDETQVTFTPSAKADGDLDIVFPAEEGQTLPVTLSNFTAVVTSENFVNIAWMAETETNHSGYNILRNEVKDLENAIKINAQLIDQGTAVGTQISYFYTDFEVYTNQVYYYWLESVALDGTNQFYGPLTVIIGDPTQEPVPPSIPMVTKLYNAFPNPFNPNTNIRYSLKEAGKVKIEIYNMKGQKIKSYNQEHASPGYYQVSWDGRDENGKNVASGIYLYRLTTANYTSAKKMVLAK